MTRVLEAEVIMADVLIPIWIPEGAHTNGIEEGKEQEYTRKKERLIKRVESEQLADEATITELE